MLKAKILIFIIFLSIGAFACEGDCVKCHPTLIKSGHLDSNHAILSKCKNCHKETTEDFMKMGAVCGQDCWDCHSIEKVKKIKIKEHIVLDKCIACHKKLNRCDSGIFQDQAHSQKILKDILDGNKSF
jgi:glycyl-tRNA synthetase (class II)